MILWLGITLGIFWGILAGRWLARVLQPKVEVDHQKLEEECLSRLEQMAKRSSPAVYVSPK